MIQTGFESRVKVQNIIKNQLPEFILDENPKVEEFLKQYYVSQEYQGGPVDIAENLDQYLDLDNLIPEVVVGFTNLSSNITSTTDVIEVASTKGFPQTYGILKIDDEIITYTGITTNTFTGCIRGFSGITSYHGDLNSEELVFSESSSSSHTKNSRVINLSAQFLIEFYKKIKYSLTPGLEDYNFVPDLNVGNFIKESKILYQTKGTEESFKILFKILYGETPKVIDLERFLLKPSSSQYVRREVIVAERLSGDPLKLVGQTIKKSTDDNTSASVSEVEIIRRGDKNYYKLMIFVGYDDSFPTITGEFNITPSTRLVTKAHSNDTVITVDSTIGFGQTGTVYANGNIINYTSKSVNQFFGCSGIKDDISPTTVVRSNETYYGYEDGDSSKVVELRLTGVINNFIPISQTNPLNEGDEIGVRNVGEIVKNPLINPSKKEILVNSWVYNTSSRYQVDSFQSGQISQLILTDDIDKSSLKVGDRISILLRGSEISVIDDITVTEITNKQITTSDSFTLNQTQKYDIRKLINFASTSENSTPIEYSTLVSDVQNVYIDENSDDIYVASNSLPTYQIDQKTTSHYATSVSDQSTDTFLYSSINFSEKVSFLSGNEVYYEPSDEPIPGLTKGIYYVQVSDDKTKIKLFASKSFIGSSSFLYFGNITNGKHKFILTNQSKDIISAQKLLRKFPINSNIAEGENYPTSPGPVGLLINGVEILNYKTNEKVYYGPLSSVNVLNGGSNYDVVNPPLLEVSSGIASVQPIVRGSIEKIFVEPQEFNLDVLVSVEVTGGNGSGSSFEPIIEVKRRELPFDAREISYGGGVDTNVETITFLRPHNLVDGQVIYYNPVNNNSLGIGSFNSSNLDQGRTLKKGSAYYSKYINKTTIQLYESLSDYNLGINTVGFTTVGTSGIHKFETDSKKTLTDIKIVNGGERYENRKLIISSSGISTINNTIRFANHGFKDGDLVVYDYETTPITGLSTQSQYYVINSTEDTFMLANAGVGGTFISDYQRKKNIKFTSSGTGNQIFNYPPINVKVKYASSGIGSTSIVDEINAYPSVKGSIVGTYLYNTGSDYGSNIINLHKKPDIIIKNGKNAVLIPVIVDGQITEVGVKLPGTEYYSTPDLKVIGKGSGCVLRAVVENYEITSVIVVSSGFGYDSDTRIIVEPSGKGAIFEPQVRSLTANANVFYGEQDKNSGIRKSANEILLNSFNNLQYFVSGYSNKLINEFKDDGTTHSKIIGWAYDGNPIYGPYGYSNPKDKNSTIKKLESGYSLSLTNVQNRPSGFDLGFFVEDFKYTNNGDLDEYNGRFCITPEYPNGIYAYFATSQLDIFGNVIGQFPYFIGSSFRSKFIEENKKLNQDFDFNNSKLIRNTLPYKVYEKYAGNDFIIESNEIVNQKIRIESVISDGIKSLEIIDSGDNYKVGDRLFFNESGTGGGGLSAQVSKVKGKQIEKLETSVTSYSDAIFTWKNGDQIEVFVQPKHIIDNGNLISISGFSTSLSKINGNYKAEVLSYNSTVIENIPPYEVSGIVTDIYVSRIPENLSIGSSISIESENLSVLNIFKNVNVLRVTRDISGVAHTAPVSVNFIPNSFTVNYQSDYFDSKVNDKVYFNPQQSVGIGTTPGVTVSSSYIVGQRDYQVQIPTQSIFLPDHPFHTGQEVKFNKSSTSSALVVSQTPTGNVFNLPIFEDQQTVYVIKKSKDHIGIVTQIGLTTTTDGLFFQNYGSNNNFYNLESTYSQIKGNIDLVKSIVSVSTAHNLNNGDLIDLTLKPNVSVGIGTSTVVNVKLDTLFNKLIINPINFTSSGINTLTNTISINSHNLKTGDKVLYSSSGSTPSGLTTGFYFVYKVDNNKIKLCETYVDCVVSPPNVVDIKSVGATNQKISPLNPQIDVVRNNNLVFNLSDSSLSGYNFKIYYDRSFNDEFVSTGSTSTFSISGVGTVGVSTNASLTLRYDDSLPTKLYYSLEKNGVKLDSDIDVINHSEINFINSDYTGKYSVSGVGTTTFTIILPTIPEKLSYGKTECSVLSYDTRSSSTSGPISKTKIISGGSGFKKLPILSGSDSKNGQGAYILCKSDKVGFVNQTRVLNEGFEYPSDKTLRPKANIPVTITLSNFSTIESIEVLDSGKNYTYAPNLVIVNSETGEKIDSGILSPKLFGNGIVSVKIENQPKGLPSRDVLIRAVNNTNGVSIQNIQTSNSGVATCTLVTPLNGFSVEPFKVGDQIYVEGVQQYDLDGDGYNSENYGYNFFIVNDYINAGTFEPRILTFSVANFTNNPGIAKTVQNSFASIINYKNYPKFNVTQKLSTFFEGEYLLVLVSGNYIKTDLRIIKVNEQDIRVDGFYELVENDIIKGSQSGTIATIDSLNQILGAFEISYSSKQNMGWSDKTGILNEDFQVISDNDYYQNLSYSIKSSKTWEEIVTPVNSIVHPIGLKNFADTELDKSVGFGSAKTTEYTTFLYNIINENRVDVINDYDLVTDVDTISDTSKFLRFKNKKLSDFIKCISNRSLQVDDISSKFSNVENEITENVVSKISEILPSKKYGRYLVQILDKFNSKIQLTEIITINDNDNIFTLQKGNLFNSESIADVYGDNDEFGNFFLQFAPKDQYDTDYEIKVLNSIFNNYQSGISTQTIGFVNLISSNSTVGIGSTVTILSAPTSKLQSVFSNVHLLNDQSGEMNYVEIYVDHNGVDTNINEIYFDSSIDNLSGNFIGSFSSSISQGILSLNYTNTTNNVIKLRSRNVGFGSTSVGISTYRFKSVGQSDASVKTANYYSNYTKVSAASTILSLNKNVFSSSKASIRVSAGNTSALHQVFMVHDGSDVYTQQQQFLSIGSTLGIGTFGGEYSGDFVNLKFYPDPAVSGIVTVLTFSENFYTALDVENVPQNLTYGNVIESVSSFNYIAVNSPFRDRLQFDLTYQKYPIFEKTFNPSDSDIINYSTGEFKIINHFFSTGEELIYTPTSSFDDVVPVPMGIGSTLSHAGIVTDKLPTKVFAIKVNNDIFKISTRKEYAQSGIYVTFTSPGDGNAHKLEMSKKNEKTIITINNIIQHPIAYSLISYNIDNASGIGTDNNVFALTGISSISGRNVLKVDNEYMNIVRVGFGTTSTGPITYTGDVPLVEVARASLGSSLASHGYGTTAYVYSGSYNIKGNRIFFTEAPRGTFNSTLPDTDNLPDPRSTFSGRVFLRNDYTTNQIYDDLYGKFDGLTQRYTLTSQGINTTGLTTTGSGGIVLINGIFQTPTTENNVNNNYIIEENISLGISSIRFSGITSSNGSVLISEYDINKNQLPRGGLIVSLGSTPGLGYAPLVGASVTAIVGAGGSIVSLNIGSTGSWGSGYRNPVSIAVTESGHSGTAATITATVGAGGTLSFTILSGGSGYSNPIINISPPSYENLPVIGVSRVGVGTTTQTGVGLLVNVEVGASSTTGIGSTLFEVTSFNITRPGYAFKIGDVIKPVGLVTASGLSSPINDFTLTVLDIFNDSFAAWQFGQLDYIDSISEYQDGKRLRFPLYYNNQLISFEKDPYNADSQQIDFDSLLIIFINGMLQEPKVAYEFTGGTSFTFTTPPKTNDKVDIFFYRGSSSDSEIFDVNETVKVGDELQVFSKNNLLGVTTTQDPRIIKSLKTSDTVETNNYIGQGIDVVNLKPVSWIKQKTDRFIDGEFISKSRESIEPQIFPTSKIIKNLNNTDSQIFVDDISLFNYENDLSVDFNAFIMSGSPDPISGSITPVVSAGGTIQSLTINSGGSGYIGTSVDVKFSAPKSVGVGIGTTASATISVVNGSLSSPINITNPGLGYDIDSPPDVIIPLPSPSYENIKNITNIEGFSGKIIGIATTAGIGTDLAIKFTLDPGLAPFTGLSVGYPIYIFNTKVGNGVTSIINNNNSVVGVGTTFLDNIYYISGLSVATGIITCNVHSSSILSGILTTGSNIGEFSWGRLSGFTRSSNPISIAVSSFAVDSGLSTFPTIQRRGYGFKNNGSLKKTF
jgi:hypothetical protein